MIKYVCPDHIVEMFDDDDKAAARQAAIDWLHSINIRPGDVVWLPDPQTGQLIEHYKPRLQ